MDAYTAVGLEDAGLTEADVETFTGLSGTAAQIAFLSRCRNRRLESLHAEQAKLEHLDYLIYMLRKSENA
ncbi:MAG: hypothetical protein ACI361_06780 [Atopobiaceae bacterium]